jgi:hypothetical protein
MAARQGNTERSGTRMTITIIVLVLVALGFFVASFFALPDK